MAPRENKQLLLQTPGPRDIPSCFLVDDQPLEQRRLLKRIQTVGAPDDLQCLFDDHDRQIMDSVFLVTQSSRQLRTDQVSGIGTGQWQRLECLLGGCSQRISGIGLGRRLRER